MPVTNSPLRYPGGKSQLTDFLINLVKVNNLSDIIYCEPFAGGFGAGLNLLFSGIVDSVIINDFDIAIYSIWYAILNDTEKLINKIAVANISLSEWVNQKNIYNNLILDEKYSIDLAYSALFLNRTNISGIITGGPIGGLSQESKYKIDCRFNKDSLILKIKKIARMRNRITLYNMDAKVLIKDVLSKMDNKKLFIFFDPPYYQQGKNLYTNFFEHSNHEELKECIDKLNSYNWIVTYDDVETIENIYIGYPKVRYNINYSANKVIKATELLFHSKNLIIEPYKKIKFL